MTNQIVETDKQLEEVLSAHKTVIRIVGTGGGGNNTVTRLLEVGIKGVQVIAINTDAQDLLFANSDHKILIGKNITNGLGAGSDPKKGEESAIESLMEIEQILNGSDMVFVTCGLGGGTGTGSAPVIAEAAKKSGALTIAIVTLPFSDEGIVRWDNARLGLKKLQEKVDTVIVVQNDRLLDLVPDLSLDEAFKVADEILVNAVKGITELVTEKGLVNLDFADVRTIMQNGGLAMIGIGESDSDKNAEEAAQKALQNPLLDVEINGAKNALINITGGKDLSLKSSKTIMKTIAEQLDASAKIIWGARLDESMNESLRVMLIVTCLKSNRKSASEIDMAIKQSKVQAAHTSEYPKGEKASDVAVAETTFSKPSMTKSEQTEKKGSQVFSEIFIDESHADITVLQDAIKGLAAGQRSSNEKFLREIKNACSSLYNSAELFAYRHISEYSELIGELTEKAIEGEFDLSESLIELFKKIPATLEGLIVGDEQAAKTAEEIKQQFRNILNLFSKPDVPTESSIENEADDKRLETEDIDINETSGEIKTINPDNDKVEQAKENRDQEEGLEEEGEGNGKPKFANVRDAVKFIDKLL